MKPEDMAYPSTKEMEGDAYDGYGSMGLTKRELFAAMAMQGLLASGKGMPEAHAGLRTVGEALAFESVARADALIEELSKEPKP